MSYSWTETGYVLDESNTIREFRRVAPKSAESLAGVAARLIGAPVAHGALPGEPGVPYIQAAWKSGRATMFVDPTWGQAEAEQHLAEWLKKNWAGFAKVGNG